MPTQHPNVFDLASLRVHADGSRATRNSKSRAAQVGLNAQTKLIAKDAGGRFVRETHRRAGRKRKYQEEADDVEDFRKEIEDVENGDKDEDENYEPTPETKPRLAAQRARTRRANRVIRDFADVKEPPKLSEDFPSSDLLKNIHYHAVQCYTSNGQLYNHAATLRKEYKERKAARLSQPETRCSPTGKRKGKKAKATRKKRTFKPYVSILKRRQKASRKWQPDMYRMFEGSALVCFGMLMQEMIKWQVRPRIPDGWVDESDEEEVELTDGDEVGEGEGEEEGEAVVDLASEERDDITPIADEEASSVELMEVDRSPSIAKPPRSLPPTSTASMEQDDHGVANSPATDELGDGRTPEESSEEEESNEAATSEDGDTDRDDDGDSHSTSAESDSDDEWQGIQEPGQISSSSGEETDDEPSSSESRG